MSAICLGEMLIDLLAEQVGVPLAQVKDWTPYPGGAPANVACGLVKLGTPTVLISRLGQDRVGQELTKLLTEIGVGLQGLQEDRDLPTRQIYVTRSIDGDRHFAGFINNLTSDLFADALLDQDPISEALFITARMLAVGTIGLAQPASYLATYRALELAHKHKLQILIDVNWRSMFWDDPERAKKIIQEVLHRADLIKVSDDEANWLFNSIEPQVIRQLFPHSRGVFVTAGAKGCHYLLDNWTGFVPAFDIPVVDTTGAGDCFVAAIIHQLCQDRHKIIQNGAIAADLVKYATAAGAIATLKPGAIDAQPTHAEVVEFLSRHAAEIK